MSYTYQLKTHSDIGYNNFFNQFRDEYDAIYVYDGDHYTARDLIDQYLSIHNARVDWALNDGTLIFKSEEDFILFVLKWS